MTPPAKLYKFCPIGVYSLRAISRAEVHHTSPSNFNDPLDCNPAIEIDISDDNLLRLLDAMSFASRSGVNVLDWAKHLRFEHEALHGVGAPGQDDHVRNALANRIRDYLVLEFGQNGVLSLSAKWDEPLMWSHYADQHRGIAIEYDTTKFHVKSLGKVDYNAPRAIRLNDLYRWKVENDQRASERVRRTYFFAKASEWSYEQEWRDVNDHAGVNVLHFDITAIYFGLKCDSVWQMTVAKLLNRNHEIALRQMVAKDDTFDLKSVSVDRKRLERGEIRQPPFKVFGNILDSSASQGPSRWDKAAEALLTPEQRAHLESVKVRPRGIGSGLLGPYDNLPGGDKPG